MYSGRQIKNDLRDLEAIADGYKSKIDHAYWLAEALQKDSIQNSWDAKVSSKDWRSDIYIAKKQNEVFLIFCDSGTSGLTGRIWKTEDELTEILIDNDKKDHLAHFVSSNFSAKDSASGGRRGRGKSLFLAGSKKSCFYFESKRISDGKYISGKIYIGKDKGVQVEVVSDDENYIYKNTGLKLSPFKTSGTRIIVEDPEEELVESVSNGSMLNFIEKTWWEIIKKFDAAIVVDGRKASLLSWYKDDFKTRGVEYTEHNNFTLTGASEFRVKRMVLIYSPNQDIPDDIRGIAVQRGGMTIERRPTENVVKEEGMTKVYGWVEMDTSLQAAMYHVEDVEHLTFSWVKKPAKDLLDEIRFKVRDFAKKVNLIEAELSKSHRIHKKIEDNVAKKINDFLKTLGFTGMGAGKKRRKVKTRVSTQPLRISLAKVELPGDSKRVNFGETIVALAEAINETKIDLEVLCKIWIVNSEGRTIRMQENKVVLERGKTYVQGWPEINVREGEFPIGDYSLRAKLTLLADTEIELKNIGRLEKGLELFVSLAFSVEKDPPAHGFIKFEPVEKDDKARYFTARPEAHSIVIEYNTKHPAILPLLPEDKKNELEKFLLNIGIIVAFNQVLREDISLDEPKIFTDIEEDTEVSDILPRIMEEVSQFMWNTK